MNKSDNILQNIKVLSKFAFRKANFNTFPSYSTGFLTIFSKFCDISPCFPMPQK